MNRIALATSVVALCASSFAQTYVSSPKGLLSTEGDYYSYMLGSYSDARFMTFDGEFRGSLMIIKELAMRLDGRTHSTSTAQGRSWKNVKLAMSECDYDKLDMTSTVFSLNSLNTPTQVFNASMTWPTQTGAPSTKPAPWSIKFPFATSYIHIGNKDICADFDFSGGTLANGRAWSSYYRFSYYLDGKQNSSYAYGRATYYGPYSSSGGCRDTGNSYTYGAYNYLYFYHYGQNYGTMSFRNKMRLYTYSYYTGPNAPVMHAIALSGTTTGTNFPGVTCQKLYINPGTIAMLKGQTTDARGGSGIVYPTGTPNGLFPAIPAAAGVTIWSQAAWSDTKNGSLKFTRGAKMDIPKLPPSYKRSLVYQYQTLLKPWWGYGPYGYAYYTPIRRYTK